MPTAQHVAPTPVRRVTIRPRGPFSLDAARSFVCAFPPAAGRSSVAGGVLRLAFALDGTFAPVGAAVRERGDGIEVSFTGTEDSAAVRRQVARVLSLDHDGEAWLEVGGRDDVIGGLQREHAALRPVCFPSPYEAAAWGMIAQRIPMQQAARVQAALAAELGSSVVVEGERLLAFPRPERLLGVRSFPGLSAEKIVRLQGVAEAALDGRLDADRLRALPADRALEDLSRLRGVGAWTASHVLLRGAGVADQPAFGEPRVRRGFALAYRLSRAPTEAELSTAAERWRPYRTWVAVLLAVHLSRSGQWADPGTDRAARGRWRI